MTAYVARIILLIWITFMTAAVLPCSMRSLNPDTFVNSGTWHRCTASKTWGDGRQGSTYTSVYCSSNLSGNRLENAGFDHCPRMKTVSWATAAKGQCCNGIRVRGFPQRSLETKDRQCNSESHYKVISQEFATHGLRSGQGMHPSFGFASSDTRLCLGVETSCDDTCAAVVCESGNILSNVVKSQHRITLENRGVNPKAAAEEHCRQVCAVIEKALHLAGADSFSIDVLAFTEGPGLLLCLKQGASAAEMFFSSIKSLISLCDNPLEFGEGPEGCIHEGNGSYQPTSRYRNRLSRLDTNTLRLDRLLEDAYNDLLRGLEFSKDGSVESFSPGCTSIDISWHLKNSFRTEVEKRFVRGKTSGLEHSCRETLQRADVKSSIMATIRRRIWSRYLKGLSICGVNHLHGHALSVTLPGRNLRFIPIPRLGKPKTGNANAEPCIRENSIPPFRVGNSSRQNVTASSSANMSCDLHAHRGTSSSENCVQYLKPTLLEEPFLCLLVSGGHTLTSIVSPCGMNPRCQHTVSTSTPADVVQTNLVQNRTSIGRTALGGSQTHIFSCYRPSAFEATDAENAAASLFNTPSSIPERSATIFHQVPLPLQQFILGSTRDDAAGEVLDKAARELRQTEVGDSASIFCASNSTPKGRHGSWLIGGALVEALAKAAGHEGGSQKSELRVFAKEPHTLDFSFSGIKANFMRTLNAATLDRKAALSEGLRCQLAARIQQDIVGHICERLNRTLWLCEFFPEIKRLALVGGVSRNRFLQAAVLRLLRRRLDESLQHREYEALKRRLVKKLHCVPVEVYFEKRVPSWRHQECVDHLVSDYQGVACNSSKNLLEQRCCVDEIRTVLERKVRGFSFDMYKSFCIPIARFAEFCRHFDGVIRVGAITSETQNGTTAEHKAVTRCGRCFSIFKPHLSSTSAFYQNRRRGIRQFVVAHPHLCNDNAAMIGWAGLHYLMSHAGKGYEQMEGTVSAEQLRRRYLNPHSGGECVDEAVEDVSHTKRRYRVSNLKKAGVKNDFKTDPLEEAPVIEQPLESTRRISVKPKWAGGVPLHKAQDAAEAMLLQFVLCS